MALTRTAGAVTLPPDTSPASRPGRARRTALIPTAVLLLGAVYCLLPVAWVAIASTKNNTQLFNTFTLAPDGSLGSNVRALSDYAGGVYWHWMANTALYAIGGALLSTVVSGLAGFALAKYSFRGRSLLFNLLLAGVMVPPVVLALPQYLLMQGRAERVVLVGAAAVDPVPLRDLPGAHLHDVGGAGRGAGVGPGGRLP
jgi:multiple sugar transport system permease protein